MKFRNLLSLSAVTLMSLGLTMGATDLSASAAGAPAAQKPVQTSGGNDINAKAGTVTINTVSPKPSSDAWKVSSNNIKLGGFSFNISNGIHSKFNRNVSATASDLSSAGHTSIPVNVIFNNGNAETPLSSDTGNVNPTSSIDNVSLDLKNPNEDLGLSDNADVSYATNLTWTLAGANVSNTGK